METIYTMTNTSKSYGEYYIGDKRQIVFPNEVFQSFEKPTSHTANIKIIVTQKQISQPKPVNKKKSSNEEGEE